MAVEANIFTTSWDLTFGGASGAPVGKRAGTELLGATVYELEPGAKWANLHFHHANEELIVVLAGTPTVRTLDGDRELEVGEVMACPVGRTGAHCLENRSDEPARVLLISTMNMPEIVEYPERDDAFVMTEPPYTEGSAEGKTRGRLLRVFHRQDGSPVPPDPALKAGVRPRLRSAPTSSRKAYGVLGKGGSLHVKSRFGPVRLWTTLNRV